MAILTSLFLVGYRGSGKTSVARCLATTLKCSSVDTDDLVESMAGKSIREIFASSGESSFRDLETMAIQQAIESGPQVISLGGGAIIRPANRETLRNTGKSIWLKASPESLAKRIAADPTTGERRPALSNLAGYDEIVRMLEVREPLYREIADFVVDTEGKNPENIAEEIFRWMQAE